MTVANTNNATINAIVELIKEQIPDAEVRATEVIKNNETRKLNGAVYLINNDLLTELEAKYGHYFILPSSIHEFIVSPCEDVSPNEIEQMNEMVHQVNETQVLPQDRLIDHAYYFYKGKLYNLADEYFVRRLALDVVKNK